MQKARQVAIFMGSMVFTCGLALGQAQLGLYVVDSTGERVGYATSQTEAIIRIEGSLYSIPVGRDGFWATDFSFSYSEPDCAGTEYMNVATLNEPTPMFSQARFTSDGVLHYSSEADVQMIARQSGRNIHADGTLTPCFVDPQSIFAAPHLTVAAPTFTLPFLVVEAFPVSPSPVQATFNDVPTNHPFFQFIEALAASGITAGCGSGNYCPDNPVTRGQMAVFLAKALGL